MSLAPSVARGSKELDLPASRVNVIDWRETKRTLGIDCHTRREDDAGVDPDRPLKP
jgi:hypothetical protein